MEALEVAEAAEGTPAAENASKDGRELAFFSRIKGEGREGHKERRFQQ